MTIPHLVFTRPDLDLLTASDVAIRLGLSGRSAIHYHIAIGNLRPATRLRNGTYLFDADQVEDFALAHGSRNTP